MSESYSPGPGADPVTPYTTVFLVNSIASFAGFLY